MQYTWYEIIGMSVLVGAIVFVVFRGLDVALEWFLRRMQTRRDRQAVTLENMPSAARTAAEGMNQMRRAMGRIRRG